MPLMLWRRMEVAVAVAVAVAKQVVLEGEARVWHVM